MKSLRLINVQSNFHKVSILMYHQSAIFATFERCVGTSKFIVFSFSQFFLPPTSVCHFGVVYSLNAVHTGSFSGDYIVKEIHFKLICRFTVFLLLFFIVVVVFFFRKSPKMK